MKSDIDSLMQAYGLDILLVTGSAAHNPPMYYLTGGGHISEADLIKKRGETPVLFHRSMERDEAAKTGLGLRCIEDYHQMDFGLEAKDDGVLSTALRYRQMLTDLGVQRGRMAIYGQRDAGAAYAVFSALQQALPEIEIVPQVDDSLLLKAMSTKDEAEVGRIRRMGQVTVEVVAQVADFLTSHRVREETLVKPDGTPLTVADVKSRISLWLAEREAGLPEGVIFAIGRDAGVPHSAGTPSDPLCLGKTIVFDIFPQEADGGYFYDFTRTWCLGYAPDEALRLYEDVHAVYLQIISELQTGVPCSDFQVRVCELFEARGHPTVRSNPLTEEGYVHGLGHGVGLHIHERPVFRPNIPKPDLLAPGMVTTIEPGLYYPQNGLGVRLEDTFWVRPDGQLEVLAQYPLDLVLPMKKSNA